MTRSRRFITGTMAGYGNIAANIIFTICSVPLALAYLDKDQFGLWALAAQINGYLILLEIGMGSAVSRYLAEYKDNVNGADYGIYFVTSAIAFFIQGLIIVIAGITLSWFSPQIFNIPSHLASDFRFLIIALSSLTGLSIALRCLYSPLWAFQRLDIVNSCFAITSLSFLAFLWIGLYHGLGVIAFGLAQMPAAIFSPIFYFWFCKVHGYYPSLNNRVKPSMKIFLEIFQYSKDVFLIQIGSQLVNASQIIIISRFVGLTAAATYAIASKTYTLSMMLLANPMSAGTSALTEIYVRKDHQRFIERYHDLIGITLATGAMLGFLVASANGTFIEIWTQDKIAWSWLCDLIIALLLVIQCMSRLFLNVFQVTKNLKPVRYSYLIEASLFIPSAIYAAKEYGLIGVLISSLLAHVFSTFLIASLATFSVLKLNKSLYLRILFAVILTITASFINYGSIKMKYHIYTDIIIVILSSSIAFILIWIFILSDTLKKEIHSRFLKIMTPSC